MVGMVQARSVKLFWQPPTPSDILMILYETRRLVQGRVGTPLTHFEATAPELKLISTAHMYVIICDYMICVCAYCTCHAAVMYISQTKAR
jgi:hypothetical protein